LCTAGVGAGLYIFGMTLNDVMDVKRDRALEPDRPLPAGQMAWGRAVAMGVGALLVAITASIPLGVISVALALGCAGLILFYNVLGKHLGGVGVVALGVIRATHMFIANPGMSMVWPIWLTMTHVIGISAACHRLENKRPRMDGLHVWIVTGGWAFFSVAMIVWMGQHDAMALATHRWLWVGPVAAALVFAAAATKTGERAGSPRNAGRAIMRLGLTWLIVYDIVWLISGGLYTSALLVALLLAAALGMMSLMRRGQQ